MNSFLILVATFFLSFQACADLSKIHFSLSTDPIDVVIPCAPKDRKTLSLCIEGIRKYGKNIRRVIVVSKERLTDEAEWFSENAYPFTKERIAAEIFYGKTRFAKKFLKSKKSRIGWIYQQFLKLYAPFVIPGISSNVLVLDSDVIFLAPVEFMNGRGEPIFHPGSEYHPPYFQHMERLLPDLKRVDEQESGIAHHMLFQKPILEDLFGLISKKHKKEAWKAICRSIDEKVVYHSSMSEYEIYFNFVQLRTDQFEKIALKYIDVNPLREIAKYQNQGFAFITSHEYGK